MTDDMLELEPLSIVNQEFIKQLEGSRFKKKTNLPVRHTL